MNICVTGASGFIGTNLCQYLTEKGHTVYPVCTSTGFTSDLYPHTALFQGLFGFDTRVLKHCDGIVHLAANNDTVSQQNNEMLRANFYDSKKLLRLAKKYYHKFFVYASSTAVYGQTKEVITENSKTKSKTIYSRSKVKFDKFMTKTNPHLHWAGLRLCNVYGPHEGAKARRASYLGQMLDKMIRNEPIELFEDGTQVRDWCYVEDVCQAFYKAIHSKYTGIYNIGSGQQISFINLFDKLAALTGYTQKPLWIPNKYAKQYQNNVSIDLDKALHVLGYNPEFDIDKGLESYYKWKKIDNKV